MACETFPEKHYNQSADIWSFGITLIEMADQRPPYADMNPAKVIFKVISSILSLRTKPFFFQFFLGCRGASIRCLNIDKKYFMFRL